MNQCNFIGNMTRDIELRYSQGGMAFAKSAIAVSHKFTSNGEKKESVMYLDFTVFGKSAETFNQYVRKGNKVALVGRLDFEQWTDQNGQKRSKHTLAVDTFEFLTPKSDGNQQNPAQNQNQGQNYQPQQNQAYSPPMNQNNNPAQNGQQYQAPAPQYEQQQENGSYKAVPPPRQHQGQQQIPSIDIDEDEIPF